jgi:hypothetical protein
MLNWYFNFVPILLHVLISVDASIFYWQHFFYSVQKYVAGIMEEYTAQELSYFEMNLETWRQLWRVLEISDVLLLIVDVRTPVSCCSIYNQLFFHTVIFRTTRGISRLIERCCIIATEFDLVWSMSLSSMIDRDAWFEILVSEVDTLFTVYKYR